MTIFVCNALTDNKFQNDVELAGVSTYPETFAMSMN